MFRQAHWVFPILIAVLVAACAEANDLGDAPPDSTLILTAEPSWTEGIQNIFHGKCATCHTSNPDPSVPRNVPTDLDLFKYKGDGITFRGALDILPFIRAGVLVGNVPNPPTRRMPLDFATPLTNHEIDNMIRWADLGGPLGIDTSGCVNPADDAERLQLELRGIALFDAAQSAGGVACRQCHPLPHYSGLPCNFLRPKVLYMFDNIAGNGNGAWDAYPLDDKNALLFISAQE